ncbi:MULTISPECIES: S8 family serine peptidase [unclassified Variovorax]|uniref:S8 family serine peptidase n=1 Tax=unclassified Variovorax TaxID=663243 RepID=UPI002578B091|nr:MULTISPECIES: S8 family serine peptidase [unclassified Variovorax]MDM0088318.1 S8 family serine peptidase [Variovorax sp. J22G40]MDM0146391.1 S8 family serine peptidase [Variovorax sp. J2P1-31]
MKKVKYLSCGWTSAHRALPIVALALLAGCGGGNGGGGNTGGNGSTGSGGGGTDVGGGSSGNGNGDVVAASPNRHTLDVRCADTAAPLQRATAANEDPLFTDQWYLKNIGQAVFADTLPCAGVDLNIGTLHAQGLRGQGVKVAVVDSGIDIGHEDLAANIVPGGSKNFLDDTQPLGDKDGHGTNVAGIVAALGWNGRGGRGVAPEAGLQGFNVGEVIFSGTVAEQAAAFRKYVGYAWGEGAEAKSTDVFNTSLGAPYTGAYPAIAQAELQAWESLMSGTRAGKGGVYVYAAGNGFMQPEDMEKNDQFAGCDASAAGLSCVLANTDPAANFRQTIAVASVNARGARSYFSSAGAAVWVSAPGGEGGRQLDVAGPGQRDYGPGIVTTDIRGCAEGLNTTAMRLNALDGGTPLDPDCHYTAAFGGTSSAAPMVAGIAALMLNANPALTQRDVKFILASTARPLDLAQPAVSARGTLVDAGWVSNAAGYRFSNWYGFGLVDASAAVAMARGFRTLPPLQDSGWTASADRPSEIGGAPSSAALRVRLDANVAIESVQFSLATSHTRPSALSATLTSPSGTVSHVLTPMSTLKGGSDFGIPLSSSNAFFAEASKGEWVLRVTDVSGQPVSGAQLRSFQLRVTGHAKRS